MDQKGIRLCHGYIIVCEKFTLPRLKEGLVCHRTGPRSGGGGVTERVKQLCLFNPLLQNSFSKIVDE